jgi:hypothetical protein
MKISFLTLLLVASVSSVAIAADKTDGKSETMAVEKIICSKTYVPASGIQSPEYRPGLTVKGEPVASADLNPAPTDSTPDYVEVPMTIDLAERMNLSQAGAEAKMPVANIKIYKNGKVEYNGQDISSNTTTLCGVAEKSEKLGVMMIEPAAGQDQMIAAPSETVNPTEPRYQSDKVAPENIEPQAGSVAASTTSPPPKIDYKIQKGTVNRAPVNLNALNRIQ